MRIITRQEWGARPPKRVTPFKWPAAELYVHHLATEAWHGPAGMRACQRFHQDTRGWRDIAYSFLVDDGGQIYEGTGPHVVGTHTAGRNSRAMAICAMGNFESRQPPRTMIESIAWLAAHGRSEGWWGDITGGHRDSPQATTACPGKHLYAAVPAIRALSKQEDDDVTPEQQKQLDRIELRATAAHQLALGIAEALVAEEGRDRHYRDSLAALIRRTHPES